MQNITKVETLQTKRGGGGGWVGGATVIGKLSVSGRSTN